MRAARRVGDRVEESPIHMCVCVDLQHEAYGLCAGHIDQVIRIDAARRSR
jgi:hypothetical protein